MDYNNIGNFNSDGHSRLPKPTYSGTLTDGYDESKTKRQKIEPATYSPSLYSNSSNYGNPWSNNYTSQLPPFTSHNQYFPPSTQPTQFNFSSPPVYTRNCIPSVDQDTPYSCTSNMPERASLYYGSAPALMTNSDYRRPGNYEDVTISTAKKTYLVEHEGKEKDTLMKERTPIISNEAQDFTMPAETLRRDIGLANSTIEDNRNIEPDEVESDEQLELKGSRKVTLVPGTSIALITDEDIKRWREERKKMWLLRISNNKKKHMEEMGIKEDELNGQSSILKESRKEKQFIQSIQNQVQRGNPKVDLNLKLIQREFANENSKLLDFIRELGDAGLLEYELSQEEKDILFGASGDNNRNNYKPNHRNRKANINRANFSRSK